MKLRNKINLYTSFLFAVLLILINSTIYFSFHNLILDGELHTAKKEIDKTTREFSDSIGTIPEDDLLRSYVPINGMIQIVTEKNQINTAVTSATEQALIQSKSSFYQQEISKLMVYQNKSYVFESMPIILPDGTIANLQMIKGIQTATDNLIILRYVMLAVSLIALIPMILSSKFLSNLITQPILSMIHTMQEIRVKGQFKRLPLEGHSNDELFQMGEAFNHMIDLLEVNYQKQTEFVSNASHELRTPLTIIESYASLLKRRGLSDPDLSLESIEAILSEAIRMREMTEQLLLLAKQPEQWNVQKENINLIALVEQTVNSFKSAYNLDIEFIQDIGTPLFIETDEKKLKQLMFIFLDNARKYSEQALTVITGMNKEKVFIKIIDRGIGISEEDLLKVFDRFYRVDKARSRKQGGSGLGLSLAKEIADAIDVHLLMESEEGMGTTVTLEI
ncbi:sensor histidine kinase [Neobacillus sp. Marseille-QA0830]